MTTYADVKTQFMGLLNRRDITPTLVDTFMGFAIQRIQRQLRLPAMEKLVQFTTDGTSQIAIPGDLLEVISIHTNDPVNSDKLIRTDLQSILKLAQVPGIPKFYHREVGTFYLGPYPPLGTTVFVHYYADASALAADTDFNWLTDVAPTLLIYAALSYACDYFLDDRKQMFESTYAQIADELQQMAHQDELENASISAAFDPTPSYVGPFYGW